MSFCLIMRSYTWRWSLWISYRCLLLRAFALAYCTMRRHSGTLYSRSAAYAESAHSVSHCIFVCLPQCTLLRTGTRSVVVSCRVWQLSCGRTHRAQSVYLPMNTASLRRPGGQSPSLSVANWWRAWCFGTRGGSCQSGAWPLRGTAFPWWACGGCTDSSRIPGSHPGWGTCPQWSWAASLSGWAWDSLRACGLPWTSPPPRTGAALAPT